MHEGRIHGGPVAAELEALGLAAEEILDFSVNVNPYGPCPSVVRAIREAAIDRYPDPTAHRARVAMARELACSPDELVLGNGAAELLWTLARVLARPGHAVVVVEPCFGEFYAAAVAAGARVSTWRADAQTGFTVDLAGVGKRVREAEAGVVYLCTPNSPTGAHVAAEEVRAFALEHPTCRVVLDQAFLSLSECFAESTIRFPDNVVCVRSMTKEHAIPGVRVGYVLASAELVSKVEASRPAWTTSAMAQAAALAACGEGRFVAESRTRMLADRDQLALGLRRLGLAPLGSVTAFVLVQVGDSAALRRTLLREHRILVRDCASFGLPGYVRMAARPSRDVQRLLRALAFSVPDQTRAGSMNMRENQ